MVKGPFRKMISKGDPVLSFSASFNLPVEITKQMKDDIVDTVAQELRDKPHYSIKYVTGSAMPKKGVQDLSIIVHTEMSMMSDANEDEMKDVMKRAIVRSSNWITSTDEIRLKSYRWSASRR